MENISPLVQQRDELEKKQSSYKMTEEELEQYKLILGRIVHARQQRETPRIEFDGINYDTAYDLNKKAMMSYLAPKRNNDEVRVNTGTTEKRIELVLNEILALNMGEEVEAFDKNDNKMVRLSEVFTDIVKRTEEIEQAEEKDIWIIQELLSQPSVFVEEKWVEKKVRDGKKFRTIRFCERQMLQGVQMYLGDINIPDYRFEDQPYLCKYVRMSYDEGKTLFSNFDHWQYVKPGGYNDANGPSTLLYRRNSLTENEIELWYYMSYPDDELQIVINGIPMLKPGHSYNKEYGDFGGYHITMVSLKPLSGDFAYGKPLTASAKTLQALENETTRNLIRKFRQALEPPLGIKGSKIFSRDIWNPGTMTQGIGKDNFERLIDHSGVTRSEMAMFDLIEKKINEFIGTSQADPLQNKTGVTATELMLAQKQAIKMLGLSVLAVMRLKQRLALLRVKNVLTNYTKPIGQQVDPITQKLKDVYTSFTLDDVQLASGKTGKRVIQLTDELPNEEQNKQMFEEQFRDQQTKGENYEYKFLSAPMVRDMELYFYVNVSSHPKESSELEKTMLTDKINQGMMISQITGRPMAAGKLIDSFEKAWKDRGLFEAQAPQGAMSQPGQPGQGPAVPGMQNMGEQPPQRPNINTLQGNTGTV